MKTNLLILILIIFAQFVYSQNISLFNRDGIDISGTTIDLYAQPDEFLMAAHISVKNNSTSQIRVKVKKIEIDTLSGTTNYFCWIQCWPSTTYESAQFLSIPGGSITAPIDDLSCDYQPSGKTGITRITYVAFNNGDVTDSVFVTINFHTPLGIHLFNNNLSNITNNTININANADTSLISFTLRVANNSDYSKHIKVKKRVISSISGTSSYFKWVNENSPSSMVSTDSLNIASIDTSSGSNDFIGYFSPNGHEGTSEIAYTFFDSNNLNDSVQIILNYNITLGIENLNLNEVAFSEPYPNPVKDNFSIDYNLIGNAIAQIKIHNVLGSEILSKETSDKRGTIQFNTSNLSNGIYFYSVIINNKTIRTNKLVIYR
ncbi:MAG: hypothetical protein A2033_09630 [Bacteroidetes bacterium GWA2_31_9]|nr:MAG: hypothetical protein A2033_09630 [Bacteroidetes bacterium GWA2_31_9]